MGAPLLLDLLAILPRCDWDYGGHGSSTPDPVIDAAVVTFFIACAIGVIAGGIGGGLLAVFTRRIRDLFWLTPLVNLLLLAIFLFSRRYPGGRAAQFHGRGLIDTGISVFALLILSLAIAGLLALVRLAWRAVQRLRHIAPPASPQR